MHFGSLACLYSSRASQGTFLSPNSSFLLRFWTQIAHTEVSDVMARISSAVAPAFLGSSGDLRDNEEHSIFQNLRRLP